MSKSWNNSPPKIRPENKCQECGCHCESCVDVNSIHLHQEIADLRQQLTEKDQTIVSMETQIMMHSSQFPQGEIHAVRENLYFWQDKYERLLENYRKLQKVNQGLEDKLLRIADKFENEKISLTHSVAELSGKLTEANMSIAGLQQESEQYKNDCNLAIRLLQCKPSQFVSHKLDSLPSDVQERVQQHFNFSQPLKEPDSSKCEPKQMRVPIPTFPPTAVVYSLNKSEAQPAVEEPANYVSATMMATVLEKERFAWARNNGHYDHFSNSSAQANGQQNDCHLQMDNHSQNNSKSVFQPRVAENNNSQTILRGSPSRSVLNETIIV